MKNQPRRNFLKRTAMASGGLTLMASTLASNNVLAGLLGEDLPYYKANVPFKTNLREGYLWGKPLTVEGNVYRTDGKTPLPGAMLEIWHCDEDGNFDQTNSRFRGKTQTNQKGAYQFKTIFPGNYVEGGRCRMCRIFFRVKADGYKSQFSQLYFNAEHDAYIDSEHWAQSPIGPLNMLPTTKKSQGQYVTTYHHAMVGSSLFSDAKTRNTMENLRVYPNPAREFTYVKTRGAATGDLRIQILDTAGRSMGTRHVHGQELADRIPLSISHLSPGNYILKIQSSSLGEITRKLQVIR